MYITEQVKVQTGARRGRSKAQLKPGEHRGMRRGMSRVRVGQMDDIKRRLGAVAGGQTRAKVYNWWSGKTIIPAGAAVEIEKIFAEIGLHDIWDE